MERRQGTDGGIREKKVLFVHSCLYRVHMCRYVCMYNVCARIVFVYVCVGESARD